MTLQSLPNPSRRTRWLPVLFAGLVLPLLSAACSLGDGRIVAKVGEEPITSGELERELLRTFGPKQLLEMIDTLLIQQGAAQAGLTVSDREFNLKYEQALARVGSEIDLDQKLQQRRRIREEFKALLRSDCLLDLLALRSLKLSDSDVQRYYQAHLPEFSHGEQARVRLILFTTRDNADAVAEALKQPDADFAGLAKAFSEDPTTREQGGDTGFFEHRDYNAAISDAAFKLAPGQISGILTVPDGFAILQGVSRRPAGPLPFTEVKGAARSRMELEQLEGARMKWLRQARRGAQVVIPDEILNAQVKILLDSDEPYDVVNLTPEMPVSPR